MATTLRPNYYHVCTASSNLTCLWSNSHLEGNITILGSPVNGAIYWQIASYAKQPDLCIVTTTEVPFLDMDIIYIDRGLPVKLSMRRSLT